MSYIPSSRSRRSPTGRSAALLAALAALAPQPEAVSQIAVQPWRGGTLCLMREPWGHHTILHKIGSSVNRVAEADAAILAELLFLRLLRGDRGCMKPPLPAAVTAGLVHA